MAEAEPGPADTAAEAAKPKPEPVAAAEAADVQPLQEPEETAGDRAAHFRAVAQHREQAVEHPGRTQIEAARAAQARIDQERAEQKAGEPPVTMGGTERTAEAQHSREVEAD